MKIEIEQTARFGYVCRTWAVAAGLGIAVAAGGITAGGIGPALAQTDVQAETRPFDIPAGPLAEALMVFGRQSGLQVSADAAAFGGIIARAVSGTLTTADALSRLLAGTGVTYSFTGTNTVTIAGSSDGTMLSPITVEGQGLPRQAQIGNLPEPYAGGQVARGGQLGLLGTRDIFDVPFSITAYTNETIKNQQANSVADVVANNPSVRLNSPRFGERDEFMIRGFGTANSNYTSVNGLFGIASNLRNQLEPYERVEVIKGPTALLNNNPNIRAVGGSINLVPKRAEDEPITSVTGQFMTESHLGGHADFGRRFGTDKRFGLRVNLAERGGETPIDNNSEDIRIGSVALDYRGENFRLTGDFVHQDRLINSPQVLFLSVANGVAVPKAPDANNNLEQPWAFLDSSDTYVAVGGEVDISDSVTVYAKLGHNWSTDTYVTSSGSITNGEGDTSMTVGAYPYATKTWAGETGVRGEFETGAVSHNLSAALSAYNMLGEYPSQTLQAGVASNIYSPSYISPADYSFINRSFPTSSDQESQAVAISDTIGFFDDRLNLLLGARYQTINQKSFNSTTGVQTSSYADNKISPAAGIVIEPVRDVSVYMNYMENLEPGPTAGSTLSNAGEQFAPIVSKQWEAGVKWDAKTFGVTASIFQIIQPSQTTENNTLSVGGEQRNRGLELEMFGEATKGVRLLAGLAFTEGKLTKTANGTNEGNTAVGVPEVQANLGVEWDVPGIDGLTFLGRSLYTSSSYVNAANTQEIPDWWRLDIGARYAFAAYETPLIARLNVENVLDDNYWQSAGRSFITTGAPLTALLSLTAEF